jgi:hypothetical protein
MFNVHGESIVPSIVTFGAQMTKKTLKTLDNNNGIQNPNGSNIMYKSSHMMDSSLCIHSEGYIRGKTQMF